MWADKEVKGHIWSKYVVSAKHPEYIFCGLDNVAISATTEEHKKTLSKVKICESGTNALFKYHDLHNTIETDLTLILSKQIQYFILYTSSPLQGLQL